MTKDKAQKRAIRARMAKTGEAYSTARRYLLDKHRVESSPGSSTPPLEAIDASSPPPEAPSLPPRTADPGMSDEANRRGTGMSWDELFARLDAWGARERIHAEIARYAAQEFGISGW